MERTENFPFGCDLEDQRRSRVQVFVIEKNYQGVGRRILRE